ncbi:MAG: SurA N-terminal domain-containing protein [Shewanella sp.]|nr:SurA N-terminal domain-containing protein [Shewanella sp.]MCF1429807.1 SurA N-terminal domain-containing protein [Shewanella sp.]MCF1437860.1 SurA N-terminal domain-containing protein [Shewanella sp.]MCF1456805.1 SurA N-terminal domain-containing protein [Shewanella sp.]
MLEKIREGSQGVIAKSILILVILSFAFAGVSSYLGSSREVPAATVNGQVISNAELEQAYQNERSRMEQQLGDMFSALSSDQNYLANLKKSVLDKLVAQVLIEQAANELGLRVSDEQVKQAIMSESAFQTDGKFDNSRYISLLAQLGYQPAAFSEMMRQDLTSNQLVATLVNSEFVLAGEAKQLAELQGQTRDIQYKIVDAKPYTKDVSVTESQAKAYYDGNQAEFVSPEMISLDYVDLSVADLAKHIKVTDAEAEAYYNEHRSAYQTPEKRLAAHILINTGDDGADKAKAEALHKELENGADFAMLAKENSNDQFSADKGGQLDWYEKGVMQPEFDKALFAIPKKGGISPVVKSDFGYHIIKLKDIEPGQTAAFADVKQQVINQLKTDKATDEFYQLEQKLKDVSYEVPDTLADAAKEVGAKVRTTAMFPRNNPPAALANAAVIQAAFSDPVLLNGENSDVIELAPNHAIVVRVNKHKNAGVVPFADVKADIEARLVQEQTNELARNAAQGLMNQIKAGDKVALNSRNGLGRFTEDLNPAIVNKAFRMAEPADKPSVDTVALPQGYAVVVLDKVNTAQGINDTVLATISQRLGTEYANAEYLALVADLKSKAKIEYPVQETQVTAEQ